MFRYDYIKRVIEQFAEMLAGIVGLKRQGKYEAALEEVAATYAALKVDRKLLELIDSRSLASTLGPPEKLRAVVRLMIEEGEIHLLRGEAALARRRFRRASELLAIGLESSSVEGDDELRQMLAVREE